MYNRTFALSATSVSIPFSRWLPSGRLIVSIITSSLHIPRARPVGLVVVVVTVTVIVVIVAAGGRRVEASIEVVCPSCIDMFNVRNGRPCLPQF